MYHLFGSPRSINDLKRQRIADAHREQIPIVVIDDNPFPYLELLRKHHFNLQQMTDISDVKAVQGYSVILCDIRGIGHSLNPTLEGAHVISEIRRFYPHKVIVAYTAQQFDPTYNSYLSHADFIKTKDIDVADWVETLDQANNMALNPAVAWKRIRTRLLDMDVAVADIMKLEDQWVNFVEHKQPTFPNKKYSSSFPDKAKPLLDALGPAIKLLASK